MNESLLVLPQAESALLWSEVWTKTPHFIRVINEQFTTRKRENPFPCLQRILLAKDLLAQGESYTPLPMLSRSNRKSVQPRMRAAAKGSPAVWD